MTESRAGLLRFLDPQSVAVIGGKEAERVVRQFRKTGYEGSIWAVNPHRETLEGLRCYASPDELPDAPDAAFVAVPAEATIEAVASLRRMDAGGAVCYASGFSEVGEQGAELQRRLCEAAGDLPILGPNCHGYLNFLSGAALWPDEFGFAKVRKGAAIFTQSGNIGINLTMQRRCLPLAWMVTLGNQARVGAEECLEAAAECEEITAIGMHIEGIRDLGKFARAAQNAIGQGKPVVVLKTGRSEAGKRIALGHTASLAGESALYDALFDRLGVVRVADLETFVETLKLLAVAGEVGGNRMASLSCSGGEASLMADLSLSTGLVFPALSDRHRERVQDALGERVRVDNPLDYHTFIWSDRARMAECFGRMLEGDFDFAFFVVDYPRADQCDPSHWSVLTDAILESVRAAGVPAGVVATLGENMPEDVAMRFAERGIVPFCGMRQALAAVDASCYARRARAADGRLPALGPACLSPSVSVDEWQGKLLLRRADFPVPEGRIAESLHECLEAAHALGYPLVLKGVSADLVHKTDVGAVALDINDDDALESEAIRLLEAHGKVLLERMVAGAVAELVVGIDRDEQFGDYLVVGMGGKLAELLADRKIMLLPVAAQEVSEALSRLRLSPLLRGHRGDQEADMDAAVDAIMGLVNHPGRLDGSILALEVNPLLVMSKRRAAGPGVFAVDAVLQVGAGHRAN